MKTKILDYIKEIEEKTGIQIKINIGYMSDNNLYGSVTVGHFGFMLYETWQPQSDTTFQFKIEGNTGNSFDYETSFIDRKPVNSKVIYGNFKDYFHKQITDSIKSCIYWSFNSTEKAKYRKALNKIQALHDELTN